MILRIRVSGVRRDDVANPAERAAGSYPKARRDDEPKNAGQYSSVIKLPYAGNDEAEKSCSKWVAHR